MMRRLELSTLDKKDAILRHRLFARAALAAAVAIICTGTFAPLRASEPWPGAPLIEPEELAKRVSGPQARKPRIIYVGFEFLYNSGHVPGAEFYGSGMKPEGLQELKKQLRSVSRRQEIIVYCGCCPWNDCPNIRPAFRALREMGFMRIRVLDTPTSFVKDWLEKGYAVEKGK